MTREAFKESRTARIRLIGTAKVGNEEKEVEVLVTKRQDGVPEFKKLTDIIEREGTFECIGKLVESEEILGEMITYYPPRIKTELTDDKGEASFKYVAKPAPKWASEYGEWKVTPVDYGKDVEQSKAFSDRRKASRLALKAKRATI
jgi:hypothetical protein